MGFKGIDKNINLSLLQSIEFFVLILLINFIVFVNYNFNLVNIIKKINLLHKGNISSYDISYIHSFNNKTQDYQNAKSDRFDNEI